MERYTYFEDGKWRIRVGDTEYSGPWVDRLAAYEDTGLEPEEVAALVKARDEGRVSVLEDVTVHQASTIMGMCERLNAMKAKHGDDQEPLITWQLYNAMLKTFTRAEAEAAQSCQECRESVTEKVCEDKRTGYVCPKQVGAAGGGAGWLKSR